MKPRFVLPNTKNNTMCDYFKYPELIQSLCHLINIQATGTPRDLANRLQISECTVRRLVKQLEDRGFSIVYSRIKRSYICEDGSKIVCKFEIKTIDSEEQKMIKGGGTFNNIYFPCTEISKAF